MYSLFKTYFEGFTPFRIGKNQLNSQEDQSITNYMNKFQTTLFMSQHRRLASVSSFLRRLTVSMYRSLKKHQRVSAKVLEFLD